MAAIRILCWALIFIIKLRFPPGLSLADVVPFILSEIFFSISEKEWKSRFVFMASRNNFPTCGKAVLRSWEHKLWINCHNLSLSEDFMINQKRKCHQIFFAFYHEDDFQILSLSLSDTTRFWITNHLPMSQHSQMGGEKNSGNFQLVKYHHLRWKTLLVKKISILKMPELRRPRGKLNRLQLTEL